jgi:hypothetical protein
MWSELLMPLVTCEMRWLLEGRLPGKALRWFENDPQPTAPPPREDRYLVLPGVTDMGIKRREGRIEIKGRMAVLGSHAIACEIEGGAERWCKWTYDAGSIAAGSCSWFDGRDAIVVGKSRMQKHFLLEPGGLAQASAKRDLARRGFSLELTRIRLAAGDYWSLGIEAAPDDAALLADLLRALGVVLEGFPLPLPLARSQSYPAWLAERWRDLDGHGGNKRRAR